MPIDSSATTTRVRADVVGARGARDGARRRARARRDRPSAVDRDDRRDASRMVDAVAGSGRLVTEAGRGQAQDEPLEDALERRDVDARGQRGRHRAARPRPPGGCRGPRTPPARRPPSDGGTRSRRCATSVRRWRSFSTRTRRCPGRSERRSSEWSRVTGLAARMVAGSSAASPRRAWSSGPTRPCVTTSSRPIPDASARTSSAKRRGSGRRAGISVSGSRPGDRLVAADPGDLLDEVGLDVEVAPVRRHASRRARSRPRRARSAIGRAPDDDRHRVAARSRARSSRRRARAGRAARRRGWPRRARGPRARGRNAIRTGWRRRRVRVDDPDRDPSARPAADERGGPVGAHGARGRGPGPSRSGGSPRSGARSGRPSGGCSPGRRSPTR